MLRSRLVVWLSIWQQVFKKCYLISLQMGGDLMCSFVCLTRVCFICRLTLILSLHNTIIGVASSYAITCLVMLMMTLWEITKLRHYKKIKLQPKYSIFSHTVVATHIPWVPPTLHILHVCSIKQHISRSLHNVHKTIEMNLESLKPHQKWRKLSQSKQHFIGCGNSSVKHAKTKLLAFQHHNKIPTQKTENSDFFFYIQIL